jgi:hypothetical protein
MVSHRAFIEIYNYFGTYLLKACGGGTTYSVDATQNSPVAPGQIAFVAYVAQYSDWLLSPTCRQTPRPTPSSPAGSTP